MHILYIVNPNMRSTIKFSFYNHSFKGLAFDWLTDPGWMSGICHTHNIHRPFQVSCIWLVDTSCGWNSGMSHPQYPPFSIQYWISTCQYLSCWKEKLIELIINQFSFKIVYIFARNSCKTIIRSGLFQFSSILQSSELYGHWLMMILITELDKILYIMQELQVY